MGKKEELQLRVPLKGDLLEKFNAIKRKLGLQTNTEVIRLLLNRIYEQDLQPKEADS